MNVRITPDGARYIRMAAGERQIEPFHLRFLLPWMCRDRVWAWKAATWGGIAITAASVFLLARQHGLSDSCSAVAAMLFLGLPSVRFLAKAPILVDGAGWACATLSAVLWPIEPIAAVTLCVLGAAISEKVPIFAALFAWTPWLLVGLTIPLVRAVGWRAGPRAPNEPERSFQELRAMGLRRRASVWRNPAITVLPWGACLFALGAPSVWWIAALVIAMGQLLVAYDSVRLIQMAAPAVCIAAASQIPEAWALPVLVAHWVNPFAGEGL